MAKEPFDLGILRILYVSIAEEEVNWETLQTM